MTNESAPVPFALRLRRLVAAPPAAVFDAWTDPGAIRQWMSAPDLTIARAQLDVRVGGTLRIDMQAGAGGRVWEHHGRYLEVSPARRLRFTWVSEGTAGADSVVEVDLRAADGMTELTLAHDKLPSAASASEHESGWAGLLEGLAAHVGGEGPRFDLGEARAILQRTPAVLDAMLRGLPAAWVAATEGEGTWNARIVVGHLIHGERTDWIPRARMILEQGETAAFEPFDRFAQLREPCVPLPVLLETFAAERARSLDALDAMNLSAADLRRRGRHPELGPVTLQQLLATWVAHDFTHLAQIVRVMARRYRQDVGPWQAYLRVVR